MSEFENAARNMLVYSDDESGKGQAYWGFVYDASCCPM